MMSSFSTLKLTLDPLVQCRLVETATEWPTVVIQSPAFSRTLYSRQDPLKGLRAWLNQAVIHPGQAVFIIGLGLGYLVNLLLKARPDIPAIMVMIVDDEIVSLGQSLPALYDSLSDPRVFITHYNAPLSQLDTYLSQSNLAAQGVAVFTHPGMDALYPDRVESAKTAFSSAFSLYLSIVGTRMVRARDMITMICRNLGQIYASPSIRAFNRFYADRPCLILSAGSSIGSQLDELARIWPRVMTLAVDTVVPVLMKAGLVPDFVITTDYAPTNVKNLAPLFTPGNRVQLIADICTHTDILTQFQGQKWFFRHQNVLARQFNGLRMLPELPFTFTVAAAAVQFAVYAGFKPIILTGFDLGYYPNQAYAAGSAKQLKMQQLPDGRWQKSDGEVLRETTDICGNLILQDAILHNQTVVINNYLSTLSGPVFNATAGGLVTSAPAMSIAEVEAAWLMKPIEKPVPECAVPSAFHYQTDLAVFLRRLDELSQVLTGVESQLKQPALTQSDRSRADGSLEAALTAFADVTECLHLVTTADEIAGKRESQRNTPERHTQLSAYLSAICFFQHACKTGLEI